MGRNQLIMILLVVICLVIIQIQIIGTTVGIQQILGVALIQPIAVNVSQYTFTVAFKAGFGNSFPSLKSDFFTRKYIHPNGAFLAKISS